MAFYGAKSRGQTGETERNCAGRHYERRFVRINRDFARKMCSIGVAYGYPLLYRNAGRFVKTAAAVAAGFNAILIFLPSGARRRRVGETLAYFPVLWYTVK